MNYVSSGQLHQKLVSWNHPHLEQESGKEQGQGELPSALLVHSFHNYCAVQHGLKWVHFYMCSLITQPRQRFRAVFTVMICTYHSSEIYANFFHGARKRSVKDDKSNSSSKCCKNQDVCCSSQVKKHVKVSLQDVISTYVTPLYAQE